jgi:hypothetical protein
LLPLLLLLLLLVVVVVLLLLVLVLPSLADGKVLAAVVAVVADGAGATAVGFGARSESLPPTHRSDERMQECGQDGGGNEVAHKKRSRHERKWRRMGNWTKKTKEEAERRDGLSELAW